MKYAREILKDVEGYTPGEQPKESGIIKLNTNENPYPPSPKALEAIANAGGEALRRYPDPLSVAFRRTCAEQYGVDNEDWILIGNGMDELLYLAIRTFVDPGDTVLSVDPTYSLYEVLAKLHGAHFRGVPLDDQFQLTEEFFSATGRLCFFPRPNAPSGVSVPRKDIDRLCRGFNGIIVIDEAYVDFADDDCMDFARRFENVIVMRTYSKSFSMAGMRIGVAVANPDIINEFLKTKDSYNMDALSQLAGRAAMEDYAYMRENAAKVRVTRTRLIRGLEALGFTVPPSQANFVLAQWDGAPHASTLFENLRQRLILVRYFDTPRLHNALRISIGTDEEIDKLLVALKDILRA